MVSTDPSPASYPQLYTSVKHYVDRHYEDKRYLAKLEVQQHLEDSILRDDYLREAGLDPAHPNAMPTFRQVLWKVVRHYACPKTGWWSKSRGKASQFFHEDWGTPEDCRDALNFLLRDRERDESSIQRLYAITETKCGQLGWSFDPEHNEAGVLVHVNVWKYVTA